MENINSPEHSPKVINNHTARNPIQERVRIMAGPLPLPAKNGLSIDIGLQLPIGRLP